MRSSIRIMSITIVLSLATTTGVKADGGDFLLGLGVGVIGKTIIDNAQRGNGGNQRRYLKPGERRYIDPPSGPDRSATRAAERRQREAEQAEMRDTQSRLNMLNFDAGIADGSPGPKTKKAIRDFQQSLNQPQTGTLTDSQKQMLISSTTTTASSGAAVSSPQVAAPAVNSPADAVRTLPAVPASAPPVSFQSTLPAPSASIPVSGTAPQQVLTVTGASATLPGATLPGSPVNTNVSVLGVYPTIASGEAMSLLQAALPDGNCKSVETSIICSSQSASLKDDVVIGTMSAANGGKVHTVLRSMTFSPAMDRSIIEGRLGQSYPTLMSVSDHRSSSSIECGQLVESFRPNDFGRLKDWIRSGEGADTQVAILAAKCDYHYEVSIPAGDKISEITIALFSGKPIVAALSEGQASTAVAPTAAPEIKF